MFLVRITSLVMTAPVCGFDRGCPRWGRHPRSLRVATHRFIQNLEGIIQALLPTPGGVDASKGEEVYHLEVAGHTAARRG